jgi:hypothetical protein
LTDEPTEIAIPTKQAQITPQPVSIRHLTELLREQHTSLTDISCLPKIANAGQINTIMDFSDGKLLHKMARYSNDHLLQIETNKPPEPVHPQT